MKINTKTRQNPECAEFYLKEGAQLVLRPEGARPNSWRLTPTMRLRLADGTFLDGKWSYAKMRLWRLAKLREIKTVEGWQAWILR